MSIRPTVEYIEPFSFNTNIPNAVEKRILERSRTPYKLMGILSSALNEHIHAMNITKLFIAIRKKYFGGNPLNAAGASGMQNKNVRNVYTKSTSITVFFVSAFFFTTSRNPFTIP